MRPRRGRVVLVAVALTLSTASAYLAWRDAPLAEAIEGQTLDWRFRLRGPVAPGPETAVLAIDDRTLAALGRWPLSRRLLARAIDALAADGAKVIAFDLLLIGPEAAPGEPMDGAGAADRALVEAVARAGNVVLPFAFVFDPAKGNVNGVPGVLERAAFQVVRTPSATRPALPVRPQGILAPPLPLLAAGAPAHVNVFLEADGSLRYAHPVVGYGGAYFPSLPLEAVRLYLGLGKSEASVRFDEGIALGARRWSTDDRMRLGINFRGPAGSFETYSMLDLLDGRLPAGTFAGRVVVVGATALGVGDSFPTPFAEQLAGAEVFATVVDNLIHGTPLRRSTLTQGLDLLAILTLGLLAAGLAWLRWPALALAAVAGLLVGWGAVAGVALGRADAWLDLTFPLAAILLNAGTGAAWRAARGRRARLASEAARASLALYVPPLAAGRASGPARSRPAEQSGLATVLFADLEGFTRISEELEPTEAMALMRDFHRLVERAVRDHGGVIDKFIGDGALVLFGVPETDPGAPRRALACARRLADEVARWREDLRRRGKPLVNLGIGVHQGPVVLGEAGGEQRIEVTVAGDAVNVASRLEALSREHRATVIASAAVIEAARGLGAEAELDGFAELPLQEIRGRRRPVGAWAWRSPRLRPPGAVPDPEPQVGR